MPHDSDLMLLIGRVEGKVDTLVNLHTNALARLDALEGRASLTEQEIAAIKARGEGSKTWLSNSVSVLSLFIAAIAAYLGLKP